MASSKRVAWVAKRDRAKNCPAPANMKTLIKKAQYHGMSIEELNSPKAIPKGMQPISTGIVNLKISKNLNLNL